MRTAKLHLVGAALLGGLLLYGCGGKPKITRQAATFVDGQQCLFELAAGGVQANSWNAPSSANCHVSTPVSVNVAGTDFEPTLNSSCALIRQWLAFATVADELSRRHLGAPLKTVHHYGSYSCRRMIGNRARMSLHAQAKAIDIFALETNDGERVSIKQDWRPRGKKRNFLRALARASCDHFSVVLTPDHDSAHHDHLHVDIGPWKLCGV